MKLLLQNRLTAQDSTPFLYYENSADNVNRSTDALVQTDISEVIESTGMDLNDLDSKLASNVLTVTMNDRSSTLRMRTSPTSKKERTQLSYGDQVQLTSPIETKVTKDSSGGAERQHIWFKVQLLENGTPKVDKWGPVVGWVSAEYLEGSIKTEEPTPAPETTDDEGTEEPPVEPNEDTEEENNEKPNPDGGEMPGESEGEDGENTDPETADEGNEDAENIITGEWKLNEDGELELVIDIDGEQIPMELEEVAKTLKMSVDKLKANQTEIKQDIEGQGTLVVPPIPAELLPEKNEQPVSVKEVSQEVWEKSLGITIGDGVEVDKFYAYEGSPNQFSVSLKNGNALSFNKTDQGLGWDELGPKKDDGSRDIVKPSACEITPEGVLQVKQAAEDTEDEKTNAEKFTERTGIKIAEGLEVNHYSVTGPVIALGFGDGNQEVVGFRKTEDGWELSKDEDRFEIVDGTLQRKETTEEKPLYENGSLKQTNEGTYKLQAEGSNESFTLTEEDTDIINVLKGAYWIHLDTKGILSLEDALGNGEIVDIDLSEGDWKAKIKEALLGYDPEKTRSEAVAAFQGKVHDMGFSIAHKSEGVFNVVDYPDAPDLRNVVTIAEGVETSVNSDGEITIDFDGMRYTEEQFLNYLKGKAEAEEPAEEETPETEENDDESPFRYVDMDDIDDIRARIDEITEELKTNEEDSQELMDEQDALEKRLEELEDIENERQESVTKALTELAQGMAAIDLDLIIDAEGVLSVQQGKKVIREGFTIEVRDEDGATYLRNKDGSTVDVNIFIEEIAKELAETAPEEPTEKASVLEYEGREDYYLLLGKEATFEDYQVMFRLFDDKELAQALEGYEIGTTETFSELILKTDDGEARIAFEGEWRKELREAVGLPEETTEEAPEENGEDADEAPEGPTNETDDIDKLEL